MNNNTQRNILAVMLGIIVVLICISCYMLGVEHGRAEIAEITDNVGEQEFRRTVINKDNVDDVSTGSEGRRNGPQSYEVIMNTEWEFGDGGTYSANAYVENSRDNNNTVRFTITLEGQTDRVLYSSPEIPVGNKLTGINLKEPVPKGRNKAVVTYSVLDDRGKTTGEVKAGVTLIYND